LTTVIEILKNPTSLAPLRGKLIKTITDTTKMPKKSKIIINALILGLIAVPIIYAANVHFRGSPSFSDQGTTLQSCFTVTGLGNQDVTITLTTTGSATTLCTSPGGGNTAPGQNKTPVQPSGSASIPAGEIKNGNLTTCVTTEAPTSPSAKAAGCPNNNWSTNITDVEFATATITISQGGQVVLQQTFNL
jgi:hypothetical protein